MLMASSNWRMRTLMTADARSSRMRGSLNCRDRRRKSFRAAAPHQRRKRRPPPALQGGYQSRSSVLNRQQHLTWDMYFLHSGSSSLMSNSFQPWYALLRHTSSWVSPPCRSACRQQRRGVRMAKCLVKGEEQQSRRLSSLRTSWVSVSQPHRPWMCVHMHMPHVHV